MFSEYRHKDYIVPRSMKEAYGRQVNLYIPPEKRDYSPVVIASGMLALLFLV